MAGYGVGASLASMGQDQQHEAMQMLSKSADEESRRNAQEIALKAQEKAGRQQLGGTVGAFAGMAAGSTGGAAAGTAGTAAAGGAAGGATAGAETGSSFGPWGALIGGLVGAVAAGYLS